MGKIAGIFLTIILLFAFQKSAAHVDSELLPENCGSCHVGHGLSGQPMLSELEEKFCYKCHGSESNRLEMVSQGKLSPLANPADLEKEFKKPYRHPVESGIGHRPGEQLPSIGGGAPTHAECVDCHNPHQRINSGSKENSDVPGYSITGQYVESSRYEYETCLKCHSDISDINTSNLVSEFSPSAGSQHPITVMASGTSNISLLNNFVGKSRMKCSDCHTNDDSNGPRGPHGSNHKYLLSGNYDTEIYNEESPYAYEFCYSCHDRFSILSNESFKYHREHIKGDPTRNAQGTSCYTCHASHGSPDNKHLIKFNLNAVSGDSETGIIRYSTDGFGGGECYLTCHNHSHNPAKYSRR